MGRGRALGVATVPVARVPVATVRVATVLVATVLAAAAMAITPTVSASADSAPPGTIGSFPTWSIAASPTPGETYQGAATWSAAAGFPATSWITNSSTTKVPTGDSAFLGASTGFGQTFGSSRSQPYLYLSPASSGPSTTTITFAGAPPTGWGFAVGDIDADFVQILATDASNHTVSGTALGAQDTGGAPLLNYCNNVPKPSTCGTGPFTDAPLWYANGTTVGGTAYTTPMVVGNVADTSGAYDWFVPSADVRTLTLIYHVQSGFPIMQLWLAAHAPASTIIGSVQQAGGAPIPVGTDVDLENANGAPVLDIQGDPVDAAVAPDGSFSLVTEQADYDLAFTVPEGFAPIPTESVDATSASVTLDPVVIRPALATTGVDEAPTVTAAVLLLLLGIALTLIRRRRVPSRR
jgi:hypothetical protein